MKSKNTKPLSSYERARKRVDEIKGFYGHLTAYIAVNAVLLLARGKIHFMLLSKGALGDPEFLNWIDWNIYGTPIIWGVGLLTHGLYVFKMNPFFGKNWEERQIEKYMNKDN
jgi:hypothetical protein